MTSFQRGGWPVLCLAVPMLVVEGDYTAGTGHRILSDWVRPLTYNRLLDEQAGFRAGRGCIDYILSSGSLVEKHLEKGKMFAALIDLEKAYDKVWRADLFSALRENGIEGRLLGSIEALHKESKACVRVEGELSDKFSVQQG